MPSESFGRPGSRAPHLWLERDGKPVSTLDLFGPNYTLLAAPDGARWAEAAKQFRVPALDALVVGREVRDPERVFAETYGLSSTGATLVRPDGFVGWRAKSLSADPGKTLKDAMEALLMR